MQYPYSWLNAWFRKQNSRLKTEMQKTKWNEEKHGRKEGNEAFDGKIPAN